MDMIKIPYNLIIKYLNNEGQKATSVAYYLKYKYLGHIIISNHIIKECNRNIILTQIPFFYRKKKELFNEVLNAIHFLRPYLVNYFKNSATNGFSVYKTIHGYKFCIPMMYDYHCPIISNNNQQDNIIIGYYNTSYRNTKEWFKQFIKDNDKYIDKVYILGEPMPECPNFIYTKDKDVFFSNITHFVYPMSKTFIDPWPTTLEEAVRCNKQIIILPSNRNWHDGIDDICSCIRYHTSLNLDKYYDNTNCSINMFDLTKYYDTLLFDNNFEYKIDRTKYKSFNEWCSEWC